MKALSLEELGESLGADKVELVENDEMADNQVLQQAAQIQKRKQQQIQAKLAELFSGKRQPPNEFVAYLLKQVGDNQAERTAVNANIQSLRKQLQIQENRALILQGEYETYLKDIQAWDKSLDKPKE